MNPFALAAFLVFAGNAAGVLSDPSGLPGANVSHLAFGVALAAGLVLWAPRLGIGRDALGLAPRGWRVAIVGASLAAAAALAGLFLLRIPVLTPGPISYAPLAGLDPSDLALHLGVLLPFGVVLPEELAFRGALLAAFRERGTETRAVVLSALAFAAWHATIVPPTIDATALAAEPFTLAFALAGAAVVLVTGGVVLALLRLRGGSLLAPLAAHWTFNATLLVGLAALS